MSFVTSSVYLLVSPGTSSATATVTWDGEDLTSGLTSSTTANKKRIILTPEYETIDDSKDAFILGNSASILFQTTAYVEDSGVVINQGFTYSSSTNPGFEGQDIRHIFTAGNLVYISVGWNGLYVINTQGTDSPADDTLVTRYHTGSTPALAHNYVYHTALHDDVLYISTAAGLSVINTQGTVNPTDDTLVTRYHTGSSPALSGDNVRYSQLDGGFLYVGNNSAGVTVIDTNGTLSAGDDVLVRNYSTVTTPALPDNWIYQLFVQDGVLYVGTRWGLTSIDTGGTATSTDDVLITTYNASSAPALLTTQLVDNSFLEGDYLYIPYGSNLSIIDTNGTPAATDDIVVETHSPGTAVGFDNYIYNLIKTDHLLYILNQNGVTVVDTQNTLDAGDDTIFATYTESSPLALTDYSSWYGVLWVDGDIVYTDSPSQVNVITPGTYLDKAVFIGSPRSISTTPPTTVSLDATVSEGQEVMLSYRSGSSSAVWRDDFDTIDSYAGDLYGWGVEFQNATITEGTLRVSNPADTWGGYLWIDTGFPNNHFAAGSVITARVRFNSDEAKTFRDWMYVDEWEGASAVYGSQNEWVIVTLKADTAFSDIGFEPYLPNDTWEPTDSWQIDWIQVTTADSMGEWSSWNACPNQTCILPDLSPSTYLQYKLDLETDDTSTTPIVRSVSYNGDYVSTGTYTSASHEFNKSQDLFTFNADIATSASTSIAFEYTTDEGATWNTIAPGENFPADTTTNNFAWRATLTTLDGRYTPTITSVSITARPHQAVTSTAIGKRITALGDITSPEAKAVLLEHYPEYFANPGAPLAKQKAILVLLAEVLRLLDLLKAIKVE
jgi:hypothetical protein